MAALVEIRIVDLPLDTYREAAEHSDELMREFALVREQDAEGGQNVPRRLLELMEELSDRFGAFTGAQQAALQDALARGDQCITLVYRVPPTVGQACVDLDHLLDEADQFCRQGDALLTLATPPRSVAFRKWFLVEFVRQLGGAPPMTWAEYQAANS